MRSQPDPVARRAGWLTARALIAVCVMATGTVAATTLALAARQPVGRLVQTAGPLGCIHKTGIAGCARARAVNQPGSLAVSPDGRNVYVASFGSNAVAVFARNRMTGALHQLPGETGCVSHHGAGSCAFGRALALPTSVAVSPDGRNVYVAATGSDALAVFSRNRRSGALRQLAGPRGCISQKPGGGCVDGRALNEPIEVVASADGKRVYLAARSSPSAVAVFTRGRGGALTQAAGPGGCVSPGGSGGCTPARGVRGIWDVAVSPDSRNVYAAGFQSDAVAVLRRTPGGLAQADDASGCLATSADEGCTTARGIRGAVSVTVSPDGASVYGAAIDADAVTILRRDRATGNLTQAAGRRGCVSQAGGGGCAPGRALDGVHDVAVSPDSRNVYVVSEEIHSMSIYSRGMSTGALTQLPGRWACFIRGGVLGCPAGRGLSVAVNVAASPDGRNVYVGSADGKLGAIGIFRRLR